MERVHEDSRSAACISPSPQAEGHTVQRKDTGQGLLASGMNTQGCLKHELHAVVGASLAQKRVPWTPLLRTRLPNPLLCHLLDHSPIVLLTSSLQGDIGPMTPKSPLITAKPLRLPVAPVVSNSHLTCSNLSVQLHPALSWPQSSFIACHHAQQ